jgi:hypothetical protein
MSLLASPHHPATQQARSQVFWILLGGMAAAQLFAFWLVCSQQVRMAEARRSEAVVQQMALSDCLQYIPGSTIASCAPRADAGVQATGGKPVRSGAVPVTFSYR